jgi:hypothetical protein
MTTQTIAKGVPPRVHEPKGKAKAKRNLPQRNPTREREMRKKK